MFGVPVSSVHTVGDFPYHMIWEIAYSANRRAFGGAQAGATASGGAAAADAEAHAGA